MDEDLLKEPDIVINGKKLTKAQAMTFRVAIGSFLMSLSPDSLGKDEHGRFMVASYRKNSQEISRIMHENVK